MGLFDWLKPRRAAAIPAPIWVRTLAALPCLNRLAPEAQTTLKTLAEAFLAENRQKEGVVTLASGLQYKILKEADGRKPSEADTVLANYRGTLIDGTEFDNTYSSGQPATLKVKGVIPGLTKGLQLMPVGSKWQFFVPSELAYGEKGSGLERRSGRKIAPNETLVFEVELVGIK